MELRVAPVIWLVPVGTGCHMYRDVWAGITGNAYLVVTGDVVMEDPWVRSELPTLQKAELSVSTDIRNASSSLKDVVVSGVIQPGNILSLKTFG